MQANTNPNVTISIVSAVTLIENTSQKILFVGQKTGPGSATVNSLTQSIQNGGAEDGLFGKDSMLAIMIRANKVRNKQVQVDAIALADNGSGIAAQGIITITGQATEAGTLTIIVGSERNYKFTVAVTKDQTAVTVGTNITVAINADDKVPVDPLSVGGVITFTAINKGTFGNFIPLEVRGDTAGLTAVVTAGMGDTIGGGIKGAADPDLTDIDDIIGERRYQAIVWGYPEATTEIVNILDPRFNTTGDVLDGVAYTALYDTIANLTTLVDTVNSKSLVIIADKLEDSTDNRYFGGSIVEMPLVMAAQTAGFVSLRLDTSAFNISDIVVATNGPLDAFGGPHLASKPYFNMPYPDLVPARTGRGFPRTDIDKLIELGISVINNNAASDTVVSGQFVTTFLTDAGGNPDPTFTFLNFVHTESQVREFFQQNLVKRFQQSRLTSGDVVAGHDMANEKIIRSFFKRLYQTLSGPGFVLLQAGTDAVKFFEDNLTITLDLVTGKVTVTMIVPIVTQLRIINVTMQVAFSTSS